LTFDSDFDAPFEVRLTLSVDNFITKLVCRQYGICTKRTVGSRDCQRDRVTKKASHVSL